MLRIFRSPMIRYFAWPIALWYAKPWPDHTTWFSSNSRYKFFYFHFFVYFLLSFCESLSEAFVFKDLASLEKCIVVYKCCIDATVRVTHESPPSARTHEETRMYVMTTQNVTDIERRNPNSTMWVANVSNCLKVL